MGDRACVSGCRCDGGKERSFSWKEKDLRDFPGGAVDKNLLASAGDTGSNPGPGRSHMPRSN